ncbi:MAG: TonB-dependent receptor [Dysgonamonadaceae bacterium]|jgi:TonB-linked SusC/RagA family outer membrane protein|nr:TonB-dependent receptor [Dysgonamonadaceae bacterium]
MNIMKNISQQKMIRLLCLFFLFPVLSYAQTISVSGVVRDEGGETLPGVSISIPGTNNGAISDVDGKYVVNVASNGKLSFSYIGYLSQTIDVNGRKVINIVLREDTKTLDEIVVVGYGTMKKSDLTGAVTSVKADAIQKSVPTSIDQVLQGRAAGVQVQQSSGIPGAVATIKIRGVNSLNATTEPIYVIDGVVIEGGGYDATSINSNPIASINPADIVSMDILKDASATAIYGSRASNGVIMITTKRGQKGDATINYTGYIGAQQIPKHLDVLDLQQYAAHRNVQADYPGGPSKNTAFVRPDLLGMGTDWQKELFNDALMQSHNLSISGGNDKQTYSMGAGYLNQDGIAAGSGFKRYNLSGNFDTQVKSWLKAGISLSFSNTFQKLTVSDQSLVITALRSTPDVPVRNVDGTFGAPDPDLDYMPVNPMAMALLVDNHNEAFGVRGNAYLDIAFDSWLKGLSFRPEISVDYGLTNYYRFRPTYYLSKKQFNEVNEKTDQKNYNKYYRYSATLNYNRTFNDIHTINAMLGGEYSHSYWDWLQGYGTNLPSNLATGMSLAPPDKTGATGYPDQSALGSQFGRIFYSLMDKYMFTATIRHDGSSKFASENRWGWFPSAAFAWRISEESFLKGNNTIPNLKLRLGWGLVGNQNIPNNAWFPYYVVSGSSLIAANTPNRYLVWENTKSSNAGIDLNLFNNRIEFVLDFYYKITNNLLFQATLPTSSGTSGQGASEPPWVNLGSLSNRGFEFTINTVNVKLRDFDWRTNLVFSLNRNRMEKLNLTTGEFTQSVTDDSWGNTGKTIINRTVEGQPIGLFYGYKVIGRFEKATDFYRIDENGNVVPTPTYNKLPIDEQNGVWIGDYIYWDRDGSGVIDASDRTVIGNPEPKFTYAIGNQFTYKNIDLSVFLQGVYGNDVVNYARRYMENPRRNISNLFTSVLDYAKLDLIDSSKPNDYRNVKIVGGDPLAPRYPQSTATSDADFLFSDRFVEDGSYLRIQNVSLGYTFPQNWIRSLNISNIKVYANLQNLYTFTKYRGYDPEVGISYSSGQRLNGIDSGRYPSPRIYTFGLNISF